MPTDSNPFAFARLCVPLRDAQIRSQFPRTCKIFNYSTEKVTKRFNHINFL